MAVKASTTVTITAYRDTKSVTRYYKLVSATASAPTIAQTVKPSEISGLGWTDTEPTYTSDSTNILYFFDASVFSDDTWLYSEVSKSSSYEAAKQAYNKAQSAQDGVDGMPNYIASRGENLVTNGTCLLGNNYNFTQFTYDGSDTYYAGGCFKIVCKNSLCSSDEYMPVDVNSSYKLSYYMKCDNNTARHYDMLRMYDIDKREILAYYVMFIRGSTTTLAQDLKPGDTTVYLTDASGFDSSRTKTYHKGFIFWNYKNSYGYQYPPETYSRYRYLNLWTTGSTAIDKTNNTITLDKAWTGPTFPSGTSVSQCSDGSTYSYGNSRFEISSDDWTLKTATWSGVGRNNESRKFREGTAFIRIGWSINYNGTTNTTVKISTIELTKNADISKVNEVNNKADNAQTTANTAKANAATAQTAANNAQTSADAAQSGVDSLITDVEDIRADVEEQTGTLSGAIESLTNEVGRIDEKADKTALADALAEAIDKTLIGQGYASIINGILSLGRENSNYSLKLDNNGLRLVSGETVVAYIVADDIIGSALKVENSVQSTIKLRTVDGKGSIGLVSTSVGDKGHVSLKAVR